MAGHKAPSNIFDYFLVSGLPEEGTPYQILHHSEDMAPNKKCKKALFRPSLLHRFPANVPENCWDVSKQGMLLQLCHPTGISCRVDKPDGSPSFHSFLSTRDDGFRTYGHVLTYFEEACGSDFSDRIKDHISSEEALISTEKVYTQKCISLISRYAYINTAEKILRMLYKIFVSAKEELKCSILPIDSYVYNILYELPMPSPGNSLALKWISEKPIIIQQPSSTEIPYLDIQLSQLFILLGGPVNVLSMLTSAFLEHQILLVSKDCHKLMLVAEAITALMFPFQWLHAYVPVLPYKLAHNILDAPVPYIMGIPLGFSKEKLTDLSTVFDQCFVDIDKSLVDCPEDQPSFPNQTILIQQLTALYKNHQRKLEEVEHDCNVSERSPLLRRNAQKRQSRSSLMDENRPVGNDVSGKNIVDASEELKNLHAVAASSLRSTTSQSPISELKSMKPDGEEVQQQLFNIQVRETIFGTLISLFSQYDKFVIIPDVEEGQNWFLTRESQQNFDKASFLSDQPECHLRFLSAFLETQAFASLVDSFILSQLDNTTKDLNLMLFNDRIKQAKNMPRPEKKTNEPASTRSIPASVDFLSRSLSIISAGQSARLSIDRWIKSSENSLRRRYANLSGRYPCLRAPQKPENEFGDKRKKEGGAAFPSILNPSMLLERIKGSEQHILQASVIDPSLGMLERQGTKKMARQPSMSEFSPEMIAQTNWKFLEKLLKDVKAKTNKLVVRKMGQEAVALGHTEWSIIGLEENTLIGSLCDLLERIWCHGLHSNQKRGKSALWSHLLRYEEDSVRIMPMAVSEVIHTPNGSRVVSLGPHRSPGLSVAKQPCGSPEPVRKFNDAHFDRRYSQPISTSDEQYIMPIPTDIVSNIKRIQQLHEVKTNVGKCRAWIRLSLEQKQLQVHLKKLLSNRPLLQTMYKRYSLLRCDDEREQFLYHLLSLNTVDFKCFTNSFTKNHIVYRVWIFPKKQLSGTSQTSANVHVIISGELTCTNRIDIIKNCVEFTFKHQNLGALTSAILGHDNAGLLPKWFVDFILIRNEVTGQAYYFPCWRWLGRGIDDGSIQRLLLAYIIPCGKDLTVFINEVARGKNSIGTSVRKRVNTIDDLRDCVGHAVNALVKHFHRPSQDILCPGALTPLLCRPYGLIPILMQIFQHGLKSTGFFRKSVYAWDVVAMACDLLAGKSLMLKEDTFKTTLNTLGDFIRNTSPLKASASKPSGRSSPQTSGRDEDGIVIFKESSADLKFTTQRLLYFHDFVADQQVTGLGKDDLFQLLVCFGLKERCLSEWIQVISSAAKRGMQVYETYAFMCNSQAVHILGAVLNNLSEYSITLEPILWRGIEDSLNQ